MEQLGFLFLGLLAIIVIGALEIFVVVLVAYPIGKLVELITSFFHTER